MSDLLEYFFGDPVNGPYLAALMVFTVVLVMVGIAAWVISRRAGFLATRRSARRLRSILLWTALLLATYLGLRYTNVAFDYRVWLYAILAFFGISLGLWALNLRSLTVDKVEERQARRRQSYFSRRRGKPKRRKRRK